ncbi:MAG: cyclic lactone autoinducer peptide [Firmicutes bacterium]|jgi:cyclic lactone autoinducer peptide|nr:cyclic lactone autoinducer peptide [Bacillota bacterium]
MEKKFAKKLVAMSELVAKKNAQSACIGIFFQPKTPKKLQK